MSDSYDQGCPVAVALDVIGDRWTLLLLRDLAHASMRFSDLQAINPKISPNLLTRRLRQLEEAGIVSRRRLPPPGAASVYEIDSRSRDAILPVLTALGRFGAHLFETAPDGPTEALLEQMRRNGHWILAKGVDFEATYRFRLRPHDFGLRVGPAVFEVTAAPPDDPDATIASDGVTVTEVFNDARSVSDAEADGRLTIEGNRELAMALLERMSLSPLRA